MCISILKEHAYVADTFHRLSALAGLAVPTPATPASGIRLQLRHPLVMLNLRGTADAAFCAAVRGVCACELPLASNSSSESPAGRILKLGPNEWLLVTHPGSPWSEKLAIPGATLTDVSHARVAMGVGGNNARDMLAKGCAIDLHPREFPPGSCVQTSIAKIGVILHKQQHENDFELYVARSFSGSFWHWLTQAANEYGYHVLEPKGFNDMHPRQPEE